MDRLLTPTELAQMLGLAVQTIYNRLNESLPMPPRCAWAGCCGSDCPMFSPGWPRCQLMGLMKFRHVAEEVAGDTIRPQLPCALAGKARHDSGPMAARVRMR